MSAHGAPARATIALVAFLAGALGAAPALSHEYWLDPLDATPDVGGLLAANVRNGEEFAGTALPYDPNRMSRLELVGPDGPRPIAARLGDFPAVQVVLDAPGTQLVVLDTFGKTLTYETLDKFASFLDYHGQDGVLEAHAARALPERGIRETYFRHVKLLARAGTPGDAAAELDADAPAFAAQDRPLELVPLNDPYADDELGLRLLETGEPVAGAQVELLERTLGGEVSRTVERTDASGEVRFDLAPTGDYLANAVRVTEPDGTPSDEDGAAPHWVSRWASLTFEKRGSGGAEER